MSNSQDYLLEQIMLLSLENAHLTKLLTHNAAHKSIDMVDKNTEMGKNSTLARIT